MHGVFFKQCEPSITQIIFNISHYFALLQDTSCAMPQTSKSPGLSERSGTVLRLERASDEMRSSSEAKPSCQSLAPRSHKVSCSHGSCGWWMERMELVVLVSTWYHGSCTLSFTRPFASSRRYGKSIANVRTYCTDIRRF